VKQIEDFTAGMTFDQFREDPKTIAAVERKFLTIGEAALRLGHEAPMVAPDVPWRSIRDMANLLRHEYDRVDLIIIWRTITDDLPPLKAAVQRALEPPPTAGPKVPTRG
jgi:uncharacterized protein with HEPN domain